MLIYFWASRIYWQRSHAEVRVQNLAGRMAQNPVLVLIIGQATVASRLLP